MKKGHKQIRSVKTCVAHKEAESQSDDQGTGLTLKRVDETTPLGKPSSVLSRLIKEAKRAVCHIDRMEITRGSCKELRKDSAVRFPLWISEGSRAGTGLPDLADENLPRLHDSFGAQRSVCLGVQPAGAESTPAANQVHSLTFTGISFGVLVMLECEAVRSSPLWRRRVVAGSDHPLAVLDGPGAHPPGRLMTTRLHGALDPHIACEPAAPQL